VKIKGIRLKENTGRTGRFGRAEKRKGNMALITRFLTNESGATSIEYGLIAAGVSIVIIAAVQALGGNVVALFTTVEGALP
jgi:pilus assembly protein Flp/PilA